MVEFNKNIDLDKELKELDRLREESTLCTIKLLHKVGPTTEEEVQEHKRLLDLYQKQIDLIFIEKEP